MKRSVTAVLCFLYILYNILCSKWILTYEKKALSIWLTALVPALFLMISWTNILIRQNLCLSFIRPIRFLLYPIFHVSNNCLFVIFFGFLGGFPLGCKCISELYSNKQISKVEADYLLSFTNNLSPSYIISFVYQNLFHYSDTPMNLCRFLFYVYGIPLIYGILLRYTLFREKLNEINIKNQKTKQDSMLKLKSESINLKTGSSNQSILDCMQSSFYQLGILGAIMLFFHSFYPIIDFFFSQKKIYNAAIKGLLEISGGIKALQAISTPFDNINSIKQGSICILLILIVFGGFSGYFQSKNYLTRAKLSSQKYMLHKIILCSITCLSFLFIQ